MRDNKGNSMLAFPEEYVVTDVETTGLSPAYDEIIEIAALKVSKGVVVNTFHSLVFPKHGIPSHIMELTGITNNMVLSAPSIADILPDYLAFVGDNIIVGHNVNFDINFICDASHKIGKDFTNDYIDTLRYSKKLFPDMKKHRLEDMADEFKIEATHHRSLDDCETTLKVFCALKEVALAKYGSADEFFKSFYRRRYDIDLNSIVPQTDNIDDSHPLYKAHVAFTGTLEKMKRADALQLVANFGGIPQKDINKDTNYLVVGNFDYNSKLHGEKSSKLVKAENMQLKGMDISIIPEDVFYDMVKER